MKIVIREWLKDKKSCKQLGLYFVFSIIYFMLNAWIISLIGKIISVGKYNSDSMNLILILLTVNLCSIVVTFIMSYLASSSVNRCFTMLNIRYIEKILDSDVNMFTKFSVAGISTAGEFLWNISYVGKLTIKFILDISNIIIIVSSMYLIGSNIAIPTIILYVTGGIIMRHLFKKYSKIDEESSNVRKSRNQEIDNIINGFQEVKSFNKQEYYRKRITELNNEIYKSRLLRASINSSISSLVEIINFLGLFIMIFYVINKMMTGEIDKSIGMSLVMYVFKLINPIFSIVNYTDSLSDYLSLSKQYDEIMSYENVCNDDNSKNELKEFNKEININNVYFSYNENIDTICGVDMVFEKGKRYGICGPSGSGKSTIFKLLNKFYDPSEGYISIDDKDLRDISSKSYRDLIGAVHQDDVIFPGSIYSNIIYGNINATMKEIKDACIKANIYDFIMNLPDKWDTDVGPRGLTLSGGQKKRISLARLFLKNPEIILLDEATAALDNNGERIIQEAIDKLKDKTTITIAHRLSTIKNCDLIYVMNKGKVIERGTHDELIKLKGLYYELNLNIKEEV